MSGSWLEISLPRILANTRAIRQRIGERTDIVAVVKANAYGHGAKMVSRSLREAAGIMSFAVATVEEGLEIREAVPDARVLVLAGCRSGEERLFRENRLTASVFETSSILPDVSMEIKIDSGMGRLGIPHQEAPELLSRMNHRLEGVFSQFADSPGNDEFSLCQLSRFLKATAGVACRRHISNSAGLRFRDAHLDAVRPGLALYGVAPCPAVSYVAPALCWKARVLSVRTVAPGETVGYGRTFEASRPTRIAVLPVGYADGYSRALSNCGQVRLRGCLARVVGLVSMDLTAVDVTDIHGVAVGDEATLLEDDPDSPISAVALARTLGTIPYEILTLIGPRVKRVYQADPKDRC